MKKKNEIQFVMVVRNMVADFYELGQEPRVDMFGSSGVERLLRADHMFRDDEPEASRVDSAGRVPGGFEAVHGSHEDCHRSCRG